MCAGAVTEQMRVCMCYCTARTQHVPVSHGVGLSAYSDKSQTPVFELFMPANSKLARAKGPLHHSMHTWTMDTSGHSLASVARFVRQSPASAAPASSAVPSTNLLQPLTECLHVCRLAVKGFCSFSMYGLVAEEALTLAGAGAPDGAGAGAIVDAGLGAPLAQASAAQARSSTMEMYEAMLLGWSARRWSNAEM